MLREELRGHYHCLSMVATTAKKKTSAAGNQERAPGSKKLLLHQHQQEEKETTPQQKALPQRKEENHGEKYKIHYEFDRHDFFQYFCAHKASCDRFPFRSKEIL